MDRNVRERGIEMIQGWGLYPRKDGGILLWEASEAGRCSVLGGKNIEKAVEYMGTEIKKDSHLKMVNFQHKNGI